MRFHKNEEVKKVGEGGKEKREREEREREKGKRIPLGMLKKNCAEAKGTLHEDWKKRTITY